ncbi:hypothetical protein Golax_018398 [Gossypium laxum]|uniref:Endoglucanase n=1 Tax=Gossypium laxum TaxID=34288 RepID=A0A7J8Z356_9ROSI|nr:hypothetical protein [Gossypium laxum]
MAPKSFSFPGIFPALLASSLALLLLPTPIIAVHDYHDALRKSILFFEGQRSGKLPPDQRVKWRRDSALRDGSTAGVPTLLPHPTFSFFTTLGSPVKSFMPFDVYFVFQVDLTGGYYDAGDNVKFGFPMAFTTTLLAWSIIDFGRNMGPELKNAVKAVKWSTDYLLKATAKPGVVYVQVGDAYSDHSCWERPEDMDTLRTVYKIDNAHPGSDVFNFADKHRGAYSSSLHAAVCPFYCDVNGYQDELLWAAAWLHKASRKRAYREYIVKNEVVLRAGDTINEFGWDNKHAGINVLISKEVLMGRADYFESFKQNADGFICSILPGITHPQVQYSPAYSNYLSHANKAVPCGERSASPALLKQLAKRQVNYILGDNPLGMSYMVGYGSRFPQRIHHRGSSLPSVAAHPGRIGCKAGSRYYLSSSPNPNLLLGAVVGGPNVSDAFPDSRPYFQESEPTTYINAPLVGLLAFFSAHP